MGQHRRSGGIFATPVPARSKLSVKKCFAGTLETLSPVESILQHDPKRFKWTSWMMGREAARGRRPSSDPRDSCSRPYSAHFLPRHGRCWAKPIQSGHAVQRKRAGSLNLSFSYREAALGRRPFFQPSRSVSWNLAGHWWEPSGAHRGCARPQQDSAFSKK